MTSRPCCSTPGTLWPSKVSQSVPEWPPHTPPLWKVGQSVSTVDCCLHWWRKKVTLYYKSVTHVQKDSYEHSCPIVYFFFKIYDISLCFQNANKLRPRICTSTFFPIFRLKNFRIITTKRKQLVKLIVSDWLVQLNDCDWLNVNWICLVGHVNWFWLVNQFNWLYLVICQLMVIV